MEWTLYHFRVKKSGGKSAFPDGGNLIKTRATGWSAHFKCITKDIV